MKRILTVLLLLTVTSCAFWTKSPEAEVEITQWQQEELFIEGFGTLMGLVEIHYLVENTGEVDINFYNILFGVTTVTVDLDTNQYTFETAGAYLDVGIIEAMHTFIDVASNTAIAARVINIEVRTY